VNRSERVRLAEQALADAGHQLNSVPVGQVLTDVMGAHAAMAQALATVAVASALLELADIMRPGEPA